MGVWHYLYLLCATLKCCKKYTQFEWFCGTEFHVISAATTTKAVQ